MRGLAHFGPLAYNQGALMTYPQFMAIFFMILTVGFSVEPNSKHFALGLFCMCISVAHFTQAILIFLKEAQHK